MIFGLYSVNTDVAFRYKYAFFVQNVPLLPTNGTSCAFLFATFLIYKIS